MKKQTEALHTDFQRPDAYNSISMPVYHTAAYEFDNASDMADAFCGRTDSPDYSRVMNPTVTYFENKVKALTGAVDVIALSSGMAAISNTLMALAAAGKNVVSSRHMFGNSYALINSTLGRFGVSAKLCDLTDIAAVEATVDENSCCIFLEIVTNPQMEIADLEALARVAHAHGIPLVADTTAIPFTEFSSHALGVDIEVVSSTKYLSGGATSIGGLVLDYGTCPPSDSCKNFDKVMRQEMIYNLGAYMTPHVAYMQTIGLETLAARYGVQASNALALAEKLTTLPQIKRVSYPGLPTNPYYALARKQFGPTSGAMVTIDLESPEACFRFIDRLKIFRRATNLFDSKSLAIHPESTIFGNFTKGQKQSMDILDTTIRLSIGLEAVEDLFEDIKQALQ